MSEQIPTTWTPEPVRAWRYWRFNPGGIELQGSTNRLWESGVYEAGSHDDHASPSWGCRCGVNAVKRLGYDSLMETVGMGGWWAYAPVHLSGRVHEYEDGYRAERAEIIEYLTLVCAEGSVHQVITAELVRRFGVPVLVRPEWEVFEEWEALDSQEVFDADRQADQGNHRRTGAGNTVTGNHFAGAATPAGAGTGGTPRIEVRGATIRLYNGATIHDRFMGAPTLITGCWIDSATEEGSRWRRFVNWWRTSIVVSRRAWLVGSMLLGAGHQALALWYWST